jgi:hypothetical protein
MGVSIARKKSGSCLAIVTVTLQVILILGRVPLGSFFFLRYNPVSWQSQK